MHIFAVSRKPWVLYALFFFSGCSALIYQIMWQRMLFTLFGIDLESITIIVSVFMFGLGVGGWCGGWIADKITSQLLTLYVFIELAIAAFGVLSPTLFDLLGHMTVSNSVWVTLVFSFLLLVVPTFLMGATFPILVMHEFKWDHNIGRSVGGLYFANTLGGALGAYLSGFVLLYFLDVVGAIQCAVCVNVAIAIVAVIVFKEKLC